MKRLRQMMKKKSSELVQENVTSQEEYDQISKVGEV